VSSFFIGIPPDKSDQELQAAARGAKIPSTIGASQQNPHSDWGGRRQQKAAADFTDYTDFSICLADSEQQNAKTQGRKEILFGSRAWAPLRPRVFAFCFFIHLIWLDNYPFWGFLTQVKDSRAPAGYH